MARVSLQIKNVASVLLAAVASACSGITVRKLMDPHPGLWWIPGVGLVAALGCQVGLTFVESKEEEELSLIRKRRLERVRHIMEIESAVSQRLIGEIQRGDIDEADKWRKFGGKFDE